MEMEVTQQQLGSLRLHSTKHILFSLIDAAFVLC